MNAGTKTEVRLALCLGFLWISASCSGIAQSEDRVEKSLIAIQIKQGKLTLDVGDNRLKIEQQDLYSTGVVIGDLAPLQYKVALTLINPCVVHVTDSVTLTIRHQGYEGDLVGKLLDLSPSSGIALVAFPNSGTPPEARRKLLLEDSGAPKFAYEKLSGRLYGANFGTPAQFFSSPENRTPFPFKIKSDSTLGALTTELPSNVVDRGLMAWLLTQYQPDGDYVIGGFVIPGKNSAGVTLPIHPLANATCGSARTFPQFVPLRNGMDVIFKFLSGQGLKQTDYARLTKMLNDKDGLVDPNIQAVRESLISGFALLLQIISEGGGGGIGDVYQPRITEWVEGAARQSAGEAKADMRGDPRIPKQAIQALSQVLDKKSLLQLERIKSVDPESRVRLIENIISSSSAEIEVALEAIKDLEALLNSCQQAAWNYVSGNLKSNIGSVGSGWQVRVQQLLDAHPEMPVCSK